MPLGDATSAIEQMGRDMKLPASIITNYGGDAAVFASLVRISEYVEPERRFLRRERIERDHA